MTRLLVLGFVVTFATWVAVSLFVLGNRALDDMRRRQLADAIGHDTPASQNLEQLMLDAAPQRTRLRWRRIAALFALTRSRAASAHAALATAIVDADPDIVAAAAVNLRQLGDLPAATALLDGLRETPRAASRIAMHLDRFPTPIDGLLRPLLADPNARIRYWAASLLCRYPDAPGVAADLAALLDDDDAQVRKAALTSLGTIAGIAAVPIALRALDDPVPFVRSTAARLIGHHATDGGAEPQHGLTQRLAMLLGDMKWEVRQATKDALVQLGLPAWRAVVEQLDSADAFARDGAAEVLRDLDDLRITGAGA